MSNKNDHVHNPKHLIHYQVDKYDFWLKCLRKEDKKSITKLMFKASKGEMELANDAVYECIRIALKKVKGFFEYDEDDELVPLNLSFDENGYVDEECMDKLTNHSMSPVVGNLCQSLLHGIQTSFLDADGEQIPGIKYIDDIKKKKTKRKK